MFAMFLIRRPSRREPEERNLLQTQSEAQPTNLPKSARIAFMHIVLYDPLFRFIAPPIINFGSWSFGSNAIRKSSLFYFNCPNIYLFCLFCPVQVLFLFLRSRARVFNPNRSRVFGEECDRGYSAASSCTVQYHVVEKLDNGT